MQGTISTRPERTGEEIAADRKEANAFFASVYTGWIGRRDLQRMIAYHSYAETSCRRQWKANHGGVATL